MLYFLISFVSFVILSNSFTSESFSGGGSERKLLSTGFWGRLSSVPISQLQKSSIFVSFFQIPLNMPLKKISVSQVENENDEGKVSLLDLPDLTLECILERLSPTELCKMASVCTSLWDKCRSDYLWEKYLKQKWGQVIGDSAKRQWQEQVASRKRDKIFNQCNRKGLYASLHSFWPFPWLRSKSENNRCLRSSVPDDSIMALYISLETGKFWFPAQVYNREVFFFPIAYLIC